MWERDKVNAQGKKPVGLGTSYRMWVNQLQSWLTQPTVLLVPCREEASHSWARHKSIVVQVLSGLTPVSFTQPEHAVPHLGSKITVNHLWSDLWRGRTIWVSKITEVHCVFNLTCLVWNNSQSSFHDALLQVVLGKSLPFFSSFPFCFFFLISNF